MGHLPKQLGDEIIIEKKQRHDNISWTPFFPKDIYIYIMDIQNKIEQ